MKKVLTDSKFVRAVYRHYHGETLSAIAKDFGIGASTLSEARDRRREEWDEIRNKIIDAEIAGLCVATTGLDTEKREILTYLLCEVVSCAPYAEVLSKLCHKMDCTQAEGETYIQLFESLLPIHIPRS